MILQNIRLQFIEGASCKEYRLSLEEKGGTYDVLVAWGRIGSTLQTGIKASGVTLPEAQKAYDKILKEKTAKGYTPDGSTSGLTSGIGSSIITDAQQRDTGIYPQLLVAITEDEAETYLTNDNWTAQEKFNGKRMSVKKSNLEIFAANKKGQKVGFPDAIAKAVATFSSSFLADGEAIGERLHAFDLLELNGTDLRPYAYSDRLTYLQDLLKDSKTVVVAKTAIGTTAKRKLMAELKAAKKEGIVFKQLSAPWSAGRPESGGPAIKCKFWASCSCVVLAHNAKRSVVAGLDGQSIGNVTIPPNKAIPEVGQVIEVQYLYIAKIGGSLYQPKYIGPRDDVDANECTFAQQKLKVTAQDGEAA